MHFFFMLAYPMLLSVQLTIKAEMVNTQEVVIGVAKDPELLGFVEKEANLLSPEVAADRSEAYGVRQLIEDGEEINQTLQRFLEVDTYMRETVFKDESFLNVRKHCRNRDELCTFWAAVGECEEYPLYMTAECAPACLSCDKLHFKARIHLDESAQEAIDRSEAYGRRQQLGEGEEEEQEQVLQRLLEVDRYMNETVYKDDSYQKVKSYCRNRHEHCTLWAVRGRCTENAEYKDYMIMECAPACYSCNKIVFEQERQALMAGEETPARVWMRNEHTVTSFVVAGRDLAQYGMEETELTEEEDEGSDPFELYEDFNIGDKITGKEGWWDLLLYYQQLERPSLSFYVDKVARKRWLPTMGFEQPKLFVLSYADELTESHRVEDEKTALLKLLPNETDYVAKPSHMTKADGTWIVGYDNDSKRTLISRGVMKLNEEHLDVSSEVAESLAGSLHDSAVWYEAWATKNVKPGVVVEERFSAHYDEDTPPVEFCMFTMWGRMWVGQFKYTDDDDQYLMGFVHRNGTMAAGSALSTLPDWVDWQRLVDIAEQLGAHKDHFRTDIFVGVPAGSVRAGATEEERKAALKYVVSESEIFPTTRFFDSQYKPWSGGNHSENALTLEGARLWIAGYKMGNYRVVPNTEVPKAYLKLGDGLPLQ